MYYEKCAQELIDCMIKNQQTRCQVQKNITELAKGEVAVLSFLLENDGVNAYEISQYFQINTSRVAAILNSLSKKGFLERRDDIQDKRKVKIFITETGRSYVLERQAIILKRVTQMLESLGEEDALNYIRILKRVSVLMETMPIE